MGNVKLRTQHEKVSYWEKVNGSHKDEESKKGAIADKEIDIIETLTIKNKKQYEKNVRLASKCVKQNQRNVNLRNKKDMNERSWVKLNHLTNEIMRSNTNITNKMEEIEDEKRMM